MKKENHLNCTPETGRMGSLVYYEREGSDTLEEKRDEEEKNGELACSHRS
jgi:hypothetical protein